MSHRTTFADVAAAALANAETLLAEWLPDGKQQGKEWKARNPCRFDSTPGSFSANVTTGGWADFATDAKGGDLIALHAYLTGSTQLAAAASLAARFGLPWGKQGNSGENLRKAPSPLPLVQSPAHANPPQAAQHEGAATLPLEIENPRLGRPHASWIYSDKAGRPLWIACRFNHPDGGKEVIPLCWHGSRWQWKALAAPRPLYRLPNLSANPAAPVVVTEGEKAADAAQALLGAAVICSTWAGGCNAHRQTDWAPLAGRAVILWPDNDEPGKQAMAAIREHLRAMGAAVHLPDLPPDLPPKFDAADIAPGDTARALSILGLGAPQPPQAIKPQPSAAAPTAPSQPPQPLPLWPMTEPPPAAFRRAGQIFTIAAEVATTTRLAQTRQAIAELQPDQLQRDLARIARSREAIAKDRSNWDERRISAFAVLRTDGTSDPDSDANESAAALSRAQATFAAIQRDAEAVRLVRDLYRMAQTELADRFTQPLVERIGAYLGCLFGPTAQVSLQHTPTGFTDLGLARHNGSSISFAELSIGAREQVAAAVRLAAAEFLATDFDGCLPLIFDDAFAYADPQRVRTLQSMLDFAATRGLQIIVLSCNPADYASLGATTVSLAQPMPPMGSISQAVAAQASHA